MTKHRQISLRDYVTYGGNEYIVVGRNDKKVKLVRRQVCKGSAITVRKKKVKIADQTWRTRMIRGDALSLFMMGEWIPASVYDSNSMTVRVQPSFSNHLINLPVHSSRIAQASHNYPLWSASESKSTRERSGFQRTRTRLPLVLHVLRHRAPADADQSSAARSTCSLSTASCLHVSPPEHAGDRLHL